jgi:hypothetical protein
LAPDVTEPSPVLPSAPPTPADSPPVVAAEPDGAAFTTALVAVTLFGVGLVATLLPFGRVIGLGVAGLGVVIGLGCLAAEGRARLVAAAAVGLNLLAVALLLFAPTWLGLAPWQLPGPTGGPPRVVAVDHGSGLPIPTEWVDASKASWGYGDVRVTVRSAVVAPVELTGLNGAKRRTKEASLQIMLRVANDGVERKLDLSGWAVDGGAPGPRLTDQAGNVLKPRTFEPGWEPPFRPRAGGLFPGKSAEILLLFDAPAARVDALKLDLPGAAVGVDEPIRFHVPGSFVTTGGPLR